MLYTIKKTFRNEPILAKSSVIKEGKSIVVFNDVPKGEYADYLFS